MSTQPPSLPDPIFWGRFVESAYQTYLLSPSESNPTIWIDLPPGWTVLANITVDPVSVFRDLEFIGVIAQATDDPGSYAVVYRGTESPLDWIGDLELWMVDFTEIANGGRTEAGFTEMYRSLKVIVPGSAPVPLASSALLNPAVQVTVAGHSLGGALAILHAAVLGVAKGPAAVSVITFAAPMVGDLAFATTFAENVPIGTRIFNHPDIVPKVPGWELGYTQVHGGSEINSLLDPEIHQSIPCFHALEVYRYVLKDPEAQIGSCLASPAAKASALRSIGRAL
jgi:triacylglycerol lipase